MDNMDSVNHTEVIIALISGVIGAFIGAYSNKSIEKRKENKKVRISIFILYTDILSKISDIKETFKLYHSPNIKSYSSSKINYNYKQLEPYLMDLSHLMEVKDLQIIRTFYKNYSLLIEPLDDILNTNNYIEIDMNKVKIKVTKDRERYKRIELFYEIMIYKNKELEKLMKKLRDNIIKIEFKDNPFKSICDFVRSKKTFNNYKKIDFNKSIYDLNKIRRKHI